MRAESDPRKASSTDQSGTKPGPSDWRQAASESLDSFRLTAPQHLTTYSLMKTMKISELKAKLSEALRLVRKGGVVRVMDRETPVAELRPIAAPGELIVHPPRKSSRSRLTSPLRVSFDPVATLLEDRNRR